MQLKPLFLAAICCGLAGGAVADGTVTLSDTPPAVQKAIQARAGDGTLGEIDRSSDDEETIYDVGLTAKDGSDRDFSVARDGTVLSVEVSLDEIPADAQKTVRAQLAGGTLESIDKNLADSEISYDVEGTNQDGSQRDFTVANDGAILSMELPLDKTPDAVQQTITSQLKGGALKDIDENFDEDGTNFDVDVTAADGMATSFNVMADGTLASVRVPLLDVTPAVRRTIEAHIGDGTVLRVDRSFVKEKGVMPFDIEGRKDGKPFDFSVGPRGRFLGMNAE
jgi:uncharacterized membrane protein YkoI